MSTSARYPLNATGWLVQVATLLEITNQLVNDIAICDILSAMHGTLVYRPFHLENY